MCVYVCVWAGGIFSSSSAIVFFLYIYISRGTARPRPLWCLFVLRQQGRPDSDRRAQKLWNATSSTTQGRAHLQQLPHHNPHWTNIHLRLTSHYRAQRVIIWNSEPSGSTDSRCSLIKCTIKQLWGFTTAPPDREHIHTASVVFGGGQEGGQVSSGMRRGLISTKIVDP